jgi:stalled ribosome rescue protein Dom34
MSLLAIWVDREHAKLFCFTSEKLTHKEYTSHFQMHHTHPENQLDHQQREVQFFKEFTPDLATAEEILILGPGVAKHHFQTFLTEHYPNTAKKIVGCETVDHPTEPQIIALARKFFSAQRLS